MKPYEHRMRVQYYDTDKMGVVHHANYIRYFETARTEFLRSEGRAYSEMEKMDIQIPVLSVQANFKTAAVYDELLAVCCWPVRLGPASFEMEYRICNAETGEVHVTGHSRHGITNQALKPVALKKHKPELYEFFKTVIQKYE